MREFTLQSGGVLSWDEALEVPRLSQGRVEVEVASRSIRGGGEELREEAPAMNLKWNKFEIP